MWVGTDYAPINPLGMIIGAIIMFGVLGFLPGWILAKILHAAGKLRIPRDVELAGLDYNIMEQARKDERAVASSNRQEEQLMATVTNWIDHLSASEVAGQVYPMVGSELWWVLAGIIQWLWWTVATANGEAEEQEKLARKRHGPNDYKKNIADW